MGEGAREKLDEFLYPAKHFKKFEGEGEGFEDRDRVSTAVAE